MNKSVHIDGDFFVIEYIRGDEVVSSIRLYIDDIVDYVEDLQNE